MGGPLSHHEAVVREHGPGRAPQGDQRILLEPRGSRRLSSQSLLDVRVSRTIRFGGARSIELLVDVLNALNDTAEEGLASENLFSTELRSADILHRRGARWSASD